MQILQLQDIGHSSFQLKSYSKMVSTSLALSKFLILRETCFSFANKVLAFSGSFPNLECICLKSKFSLLI
jgi:hypothetical protein